MEGLLGGGKLVVVVAWIGRLSAGYLRLNVLLFVGSGDLGRRQQQEQPMGSDNVCAGLMV
jgi:hypothetical protein